MNTAITPLEFGRRARRLFGQREAVVDARRQGFETQELGHGRLSPAAF